MIIIHTHRSIAQSKIMRGRWIQSFPSSVFAQRRSHGGSHWRGRSESLAFVSIESPVSRESPINSALELLNTGSEIAAFILSRALSLTSDDIDRRRTELELSDWSVFAWDLCFRA